MEHNQHKLVLFEEVAAYRLKQVVDELSQEASWPSVEADMVKLLYAVFLALRLNHRAIAGLLDLRSLNHLLAVGAIDQPELTALLRARSSRLN